MPPQEIKPQQTYSGCYRIFALSFLLCFSLLFSFFVISFDNFLVPPKHGGVWTWIEYTISLLLDLAVLAIFAFANFYIIRANIHDVKTGTDSDGTDSDEKKTKKIYFALICFAIIGVKIIFEVMAAVIGSAKQMLREDPYSVPAWIMIVFFGGITITLFVMYRYVMKRFSRADKALADGGKMDVFTGVVKNKKVVSADSGAMARPGELYSYSIELDNGKKFENIQRIYYDKVEIGQAIEVHAIPFAGEVLHVYIK